MDEEVGAAGGDWLRAGPGRPGKGRRRNLSRKSDREAAARQPRLSWSRRRPRRRLSTFESRMQVRTGLTLLLCAVLLGSTASSSGQYRALGSRPRDTAPPPPDRVEDWAMGLSGRGSYFALTDTRSCLGLRLVWATEGAYEAGYKEGLVALPTPLPRSKL